MGFTATSRHLGLDLGATNLKWCVVEHRDGAWEVLDRGQSPTRVAPPDEMPDAVVAQLGEVGCAAVERWRPVVSGDVGDVGPTGRAESAMECAQTGLHPQTGRESRWRSPAPAGPADDLCDGDKLNEVLRKEDFRGRCGRGRR